HDAGSLECHPHRARVPHAEPQEIRASGHDRAAVEREAPTAFALGRKALQLPGESGGFELDFRRRYEASEIREVVAGAVVGVEPWEVEVAHERLLVVDAVSLF